MQHAHLQPIVGGYVWISVCCVGVEAGRRDLFQRHTRVTSYLDCIVGHPQQQQQQPMCCCATPLIGPSLCLAALARSERCAGVPPPFLFRLLLRAERRRGDVLQYNS